MVIVFIKVLYTFWLSAMWRLGGMDSKDQFAALHGHHYYRVLGVPTLFFIMALINHVHWLLAILSTAVLFVASMMPITFHGEHDEDNLEYFPILGVCYGIPCFIIRLDNWIYGLAIVALVAAVFFSMKLLEINRIMDRKYVEFATGALIAVTSLKL